MGVVPLGAEAAVPCNAQNTGQANVSIDSISIAGTPGPFSALQPVGISLPFSLPPGEALDFGVTFQSSTAGSFNAVCQVVTSLGTFTISCTATAAANPLITISPPQLTFPVQIVGSFQFLTVTITNNSGSPVPLTNPVFSDPTFSFVPPAPVFPVTIAAGSNVTMNIQSNPDAFGAFVGTLTMTAGVSDILTIPMTAIAVLFFEQNALTGTDYVFLLGFGAPSDVQEVDPFNVNSELGQTLIFNGTLWDGVSSEKVIRRLQFYYENFGVCTLTATAQVQRYDRNGGVFTDQKTSTVTFGTVEADELEYSAFFDFQVAGEIINVTINREPNAGPCYLYMFVPFIEPKGEKVENV